MGVRVLLDFTPTAPQRIALLPQVPNVDDRLIVGGLAFRVCKVVYATHPVGELLTGTTVGVFLAESRQLTESEKRL